MRYRLLETVRQYAGARGDGLADPDLRRRHCLHYLRLAERANLSIEALARGPQRIEVVLPEKHNLRAALAWAIDADVELGLRLAVALEHFWLTDDPSEGARWFGLLFDSDKDIDPALHVRALLAYGASAQFAGDLNRAESLCRRALDLARATEDERSVLEATFRLGSNALFRDDLAVGRRLHEQSLAGFRKIGDRVGELVVLVNLGWLEFEDGNRERGWALTRQSLQQAREAGWPWIECSGLAELAERSLEEGRTADGEHYGREALEIARRIEDREGVVTLIALLSWAAAQDDPERSAALWSAVEAEERAGRMGRWYANRRKYAAHIPQLRPPVPLSLDEAIGLALTKPDGPAA
jgi:tetratricopeptide (TPR) repeat protein